MVHISGDFFFFLVPSFLMVSLSEGINTGELKILALGLPRYTLSVKGSAKRSACQSTFEDAFVFVRLL